MGAHIEDSCGRPCRRECAEEALGPPAESEALHGIQQWYLTQSFKRRELLFFIEIVIDLQFFGGFIYGIQRKLSVM